MLVCLKDELDQSVLLWNKQCHCGPDSATVDHTVPLWTIQCHCGPDSATVDQAVPLWTRQCHCRPDSATVDQTVPLWTRHFPVFKAVFMRLSAHINSVMSFLDIVGNEQHIGQEAKNMFRFMMTECAVH
jgi:hypothetical protein